MTIKQKTYVTVDELTEEQCKFLFDTDEVQEQLNAWLMDDWLWRARELIQCVFEGGFWAELIFAPDADKVGFDEQCGNFNITEMDYIGVRLINNKTLEKLQEKYPEFTLKHAIFANHYLGPISFQRRTVHVHDEIFDDAIDGDVELLKNHDHVSDFCDNLGRMLRKNSGDNEWTTYSETIDVEEVTEAESVFFAGQDVATVLGSYQDAAKIYKESVDFMLLIGQDIIEALEKALAQEYKYMQSYEYWYDMAEANDTFYELTEELKNV